MVFPSRADGASDRRRSRSGELMLGVNAIQSPKLPTQLLATHQSGADLRGITLSHGHLAGVRLTNCDLRGANFAYAQLSGANLIGSDLRSVNLWEADASEANLIATNLRQSQLRRGL
ncbi:MAG: pentapeptide repeat-containing protein, partial [Microcystaceae cyanobacterium]